MKKDWFDRAIAKSEYTENGCIIFNGTKKSGYGVISNKSKYFYLHRLAYETTNGPIPKKMFVCHSCKNPTCWNVDHLFLSPNRNNIRGEDHWISKLSNKDVADIRKFLLSKKLTQKEIAEKYSVSQGTISDIKHKKWHKN